MTRIAFLLLVVFSQLVQFLSINVYGQETEYLYLSGRDKDHTVTWDFYINTGMKSGSWNKIQVPSNWEQQGFGSYNYFTDAKNPEETGQYKYSFKVPSGSASKNVFIVFEASMTDTEVKINGESAGPVHQGGFYRFKYNITNLLNFGRDNLLEVTVKKHSANESVNKAEREADFWLFGGIFRPVYLEITPKTYIDRIALDAKANGHLQVDAFTSGVTNGSNLKMQVQTLGGQAIGAPVSVKLNRGQERVSLEQQVKGIIPWNPESPQLYNLVVSIIGTQGKEIHRIKQRFGFRTAEMRPRDGFYVNNKKVIFKGVNRHSHWPETGRALSKEISLMDVKLIKEMNMNAVRMSHYPPDQHFLDVCDSLGLLVIDELTGWQAKYDTVVGKRLVKELVERDVNHPSVVIWANGNEGGWNTGLDGEYSKYDPQQRFVIHPWERFNGTDTKHYPDYNYVVNSVLYGQDVFFPTEFMHGLQDGGHAAGLEDFWNLMLKHPYGAGGFLWALHDEGTVRTDSNGKIDVAGNSAPDGIVGPHREKEGSFFAIKEIWSPVHIEMKELPQNFDGKLLVENRYIYTDLKSCSFKWKLTSLPSPGSTTQAKVNASGNASITVAPGAKAVLMLDLPPTWKNNDVFYLTAYGPDKKEVYTWSWPVKLSGIPIKNFVPAINVSQPEVTQQDSSIIIKSDQITYHFSTKTGHLKKVINQKAEIPLSDGPVLAGVKHTLKKINHYANGSDYVFEPFYEGPSQFNVKWIFSPGKPVKLEYQYSLKGEADFMGLTFNYPEEIITGMRWQGRGPYRVWKNRLGGQQFGVWHKYYNNAITGESWNYPEFKGYHANVHWVTVENKRAPFTVYSGTENMFFQMLKPLKAAGATNNNTAPAFPEGNIGFLQGISPIGTKFQTADKMGPQSQKNIQLNYTPISGSLWFDFK
jgi:hypothetical protein